MTKETKEQLDKIYKAYAEQHNRLPRLSEVAKYMVCTEPQARIMHKELANIGAITKNKNRVEVFRGIPKEKVKVQESDNTEEMDGNFKIDPRAFLVMRWATLAVGLGAVVMSIVHSQNAFINYYARPLAIFAAFVFVLCEVVGFDMAAVMFKQKRWLSGTGLFLMALIAMAVSMNSTTWGMYDDNADKLQNNTQLVQSYDKEESKSEREWNALQEQKISTQQSLDDIRPVIQNLTNELKFLEVGTYYHNVTNNRLTVAEGKRDTYNEQLKSIQSKELVYLDRDTEEVVEVVITKKPYWEWVGGTVFKDIRPELFEFWMLVLPAIFYDVVASLAIGVFIFTGSINRRRETKK